MLEHERLNIEGLKLYNTGMFEEALNVFIQALEVKPTYENSIINKGLCLDALGKYTQAIQCYDLIIENSNIIKSNQHSDIFYFKAIALYNNQDFLEAIDMFNKDIIYNKIDTKYRSSFFIGSSHMYLGNYDYAETYFIHILKTYGYNYDAWNNLGVCYLEQGEYKKAEQIFVFIIQNKKDFPQALYNLSLVYKFQNLLKKEENLLDFIKKEFPSYINS